MAGRQSANGTNHHVGTWYTDPHTNKPKVQIVDHIWRNIAVAIGLWKGQMYVDIHPDHFDQKFGVYKRHIGFGQWLTFTEYLRLCDLRDDVASKLSEEEENEEWEEAAKTNQADLLELPVSQGFVPPKPLNSPKWVSKSHRRMPRVRGRQTMCRPPTVQTKTLSKAR